MTKKTKNESPSLLSKAPPYPPQSTTLRQLHVTLHLLSEWVRYQEPFRKAPKGCQCDPVKQAEDIPDILIFHASPLGYLVSLTNNIRQLREEWDTFVREWDFNSTEASMGIHNRLVCAGGNLINLANKTESDLNADIQSGLTRHRRSILGMLKEVRDNGFPMLLMGQNGPVDPDKMIEQLEEEEEDGDDDESPEE